MDRNRLAIQSLWARLDLRPFEVFTPYFVPKSRQKPRLQDFFDVIWQGCVVNELGKQETFSPMERSKILEWYVG